MPGAAAPVPGAQLGLGDPAPPLSIATWYKGEKVDSFAEGKVYVVEFWATWCGPCRQSMPHMAVLQEQYGDQVHFIGITDEMSGAVTKFMNRSGPGGKTWDEIINYTIALDSNQRTNRSYMAAAQMNGIPAAFVVGKTGLIEWIGHPMGMDAALAQIVDGSWDLKQVQASAALEAKVRAAMQADLESMMSAGDSAAAAGGAAAEEHWDKALAKANDLLAMIPADTASPRLLGARDKLHQVKQWLLHEAGRDEALQQLQSELVEQNWDNPQMLDSIAWRIADTQGQGDFELAAKAALRAIQLTGKKNPSPLDTLARLYYEQGKLQDAIKWEKEAIAAAAGTPQAVQQLEATLQKYESELPK